MEIGLKEMELWEREQTFYLADLIHLVQIHFKDLERLSSSSTNKKVGRVVKIARIWFIMGINKGTSAKGSIHDSNIENRNRIILNKVCEMLQGLSLHR